MIKLSLERDELLLCANALNEVCSGFHVADFEHVIGRKGDAQALQQRLMDEYCVIETWPDQVAAERAEVTIIANATRASLHELDHEGTFHARLGVSRSAAFAFLAKLDGALAAG